MVIWLRLCLGSRNSFNHISRVGGYSGAIVTLEEVPFGGGQKNSNFNSFYNIPEMLNKFRLKLDI